MRGGPVIVAVVAVGAWVACGHSYGTDVDQPQPQGAQGQACYPNGTCLVGLTCANDACVIASADASGGPSAGDSGKTGPLASSTTSSSTTSSSTTSSSTTSSSSSSGSVATNCAELSDGRYVTCPLRTGDESCAGAEPSCCPGSGCQSNGAACLVTSIVCLSDNHCAGGHCCMTGSVHAATPPIVCETEVVALSTPRCTASESLCSAEELNLCTDSSTCQTGKSCREVALTLTGSDGVSYVKSVGICQ